MAEHLTIVYNSCRLNPRFQWFLFSLKRELVDECDGIKLVVVDFHADIRCQPDIRCQLNGMRWVWIKPKPTVWQGQYRLMRDNWFAASNSRNTGLCYAPDGWIAYVDDLSVLMPGWLNAVREAMAGNYIVCGAYKKVKKLHVENGEVKSCEEFPGGIDTRWTYAQSDPWPCQGQWLFGCSFAAPVEALLAVNGADENCDSLGSEDYILGIRLANAGYQFKYDRRMLTLESEEAHFEEPPFRRTDKGVSPADKSHAILKMALESKWAPNYFGEGGIRALRERVLRGEPFPIQQIPDKDWFDGQPISEMV